MPAESTAGASVVPLGIRPRRPLCHPAAGGSKSGRCGF